METKYFEDNFISEFRILYKYQYAKFEQMLKAKAEYLVKIESDFEKITPQRQKFLNAEREFIESAIALLGEIEFQFASVAKAFLKQNNTVREQLQDGENLEKYKAAVELWKDLYLKQVDENMKLSKFIIDKEHIRKTVIKSL